MVKIQCGVGPYNNEDQVKKCVEHMLGEKVREVRLALVIGHNGTDFVSSTDWRVTMESGQEYILTSSMQPQYPNFLECKAGVSYEKGKYSIITAEDDKSAKVFIGGSIYCFRPGEALRIYVQPCERFIATDCAVECEETEQERTYRVITDENTQYGYLDDKGRISQV